MEEKSHGRSSMQKKTGIRECNGDNMVASVDARHTRAESAEGKGETMVGAKEIAS